MSTQNRRGAVHFNQEGYQELQELLKQGSFSSVFVLTDTNTQQHCLTPFLQKFNSDLPLEVIEMEAGEEHKTLETCEGIWKALSELGADRKSLLINLGGGVVTDLGGFVACGFRRGIEFIHFPTTLLAMVDAAIGGKNGVNLGSLKNQVGVITPPAMVVADTEFLKTLPAPEMRSGLAEMLKHGLIASPGYWEKLKALKDLTLADLDELVLESVRIKQEVVLKDPREEGLRKTLNFGHTLGHAIESFCLEEEKREKLLHGEAVAIGMVLEAFLSAQATGFPQEQLEEVRDSIKELYGVIPFNASEIEKIKTLLKFDKKNEAGKINFVLLARIGKPVIDREVPDRLIEEAFQYYLEGQRNSLKI